LGSGKDTAGKLPKIKDMLMSDLGGESKENTFAKHRHSTRKDNLGQGIDSLSGEKMNS
jgi:hypothetical protein